MSNNSLSSRFRCLFFGMPCAFSTIILDAVRTLPVELVGIVTPDRSRAPGRKPLSRPKPFLPLHQHAADHLDAAPRFAVRSLRDPGVLETIVATAPDLIIVACFPWLLPSSLTEAARLAAINVHPSLLPRWRGPDPLFWTFHAGDAISGITVHLMDSGFDSGPIIAQQSVPIADGETLSNLERRLAVLGGTMLVDLVRSLPSLPNVRVQDDSRATAAPIPDDDARMIDPTWTVDRARRFIHGVLGSHGPLRYRPPEGDLRELISLSSASQGDDITLADGSLSVAFGSAKIPAENSTI